MKQNNKYLFTSVGLSFLVSVLIYFPEILTLFGKVGGIEHELFPEIDITGVVNEIFFTFISLLLLYALNAFVLAFHRPSVNITWFKVVVSFFLTWITSMLLGNVFVFLHEKLNIAVIHSTVHFFLHPVRDFIISVVVSVSCYMMYLTRKSQQVQMENQQLRVENLLNQYEALKNQLNPHMLFNSLNALRSLIRETPDKAQDYLQELSRVLRYTLQENENKSVSLREEMEFVEAYIFLLKMRYEDNLQFNLDIAEDAEVLQVPPLAVQLLIENAVKHNEISNRKPFTVSIQSGKEKLSVSNPIQSKLTKSKGTGIGLDNLAKRYKLLFKKDIDIKEENGIFTVTIPLC